QHLHPFPTRRSSDLQYAFASTYDFLIGNPNGRFRGSIFSRFNDAHRSFRDTIVGTYYQNDIHVTSRLTINAGLRYEFITVPYEKDRKSTRLNSSHDQ